MSNRSVFVVEDNSIEREGLGVILSREGYDVTLLNNGRQALEHLRRGQPPRAILLDMFMPILDGWHFLEEMAALKPEPPPRVIVMTGNLVIGRDWARAHGCDGFLRKPVSADDLLAELERCVRDDAAAHA
jgi:two-component system copper resistance phosphate regulon response regulator CusR